MYKQILMLILIMPVCCSSIGIYAALAETQSTADSPARLGPEGAIEGTVVDSVTRTSLSGVIVSVLSTDLTVESDARGYFMLSGLAVGNYKLSFTHAAYETDRKTDIIVRSGRTTTLSIHLNRAIAITDEIVVSGDYFEEPDDQPLSTTTFEGEEIRRAAGGEGDVSRIIGILPSIAKVNDQVNSLIVRGGSPYENGFYLDNMAVPNINHYPAMGSSGGPIGIINVDLIDNVTFAAGGFSARFGDRLSAIMELHLREGSRRSSELQADLNMAGFGVLAEGPVDHGRGSWLLSARHSYLDLLVDAIGTGSAPRYSDYQGKMCYDLDPRNKLVFVAISAFDYIAFDRESSRDNGQNFYGGTDIVIAFGGLNWKRVWRATGYSETSLSWNQTHYDEQYRDILEDDDLTYRTNSREQAVQFRNDNTWQLTPDHTLHFGLECTFRYDDYDHYSAEYTNVFGDTVPALSVDKTLDGYKLAPFLSFVLNPVRRLSTTLGCRADYFSYTGNKTVSPRLSLSFTLTDRTKVNLATGIYHQSLSSSILAQQEEFKELDDPIAYHYIVGVEHLLTEHTRISLELYDKEYDRFPMDPDQPLIFPADEGGVGIETLVDSGQAYARGLELVLQKKLVENFYGLLSMAWFRTEYRDYNGDWRPRLYDNRVLVNIEGGYKPNNRWEYSLRWMYAGGRPYTPFDLARSTEFNEAIYDSSQVNQARFPAYHSLNLRCDRRFNFSKSNLIFFVDLWNVYNRQNPAFYYWNKIENKREESYQWTFLPIAGLEWEF
ncbi:TonB-dependent receptor [bacterium]|nr:TonB-dependent receptor [bacterium]